MQKRYFEDPLIVFSLNMASEGNLMVYALFCAGSGSVYGRQMK